MRGTPAISPFWTPGSGSIIKEQRCVKPHSAVLLVGKLWFTNVLRTPMPSSWAAPAGAFRRATEQSPALSPEMKVARRSRDGSGAVVGLIYRQLWRNRYCLHTSPAPSGHPPQRGGHISNYNFLLRYCITSSPSLASTVTVWPGRMSPRRMRLLSMVSTVC